MSLEFISVKCPECHAALQIEEGRQQAFCSYCGTKIIIHNNNEHIYRTINEAEVKQAETDRLIKLQQLKMEEKEGERRKYLVIAWLVATALLIVVGIIGAAADKDADWGYVCLGLGINVGGWGALFLLVNKKKRTRIVASNEVLITSAMAFCSEDNFNSAVALFRSAGFQNVLTIPLNDLNFFTQRKNGQVDNVTINGDSSFEEGDVFPKTAQVIITYHSMG